ncbi:hypothetical protein GLOIN_2v1479411 [Rhizophagus irregularis DAOM 181602=DAOM 197198]|uniref:Uncharacterized protein n=1 Tax=Rhizophagus irregularis (strain DAOM 181602 / DAOM 197198 / MUCL 43194) TaxID=747089 RepID=A0A2P4PXW9_RHIID|nr:hypothetical protein GLOIN_2v1479411 [Rhizophagus irregularis DAOM 181602=DAOM 197198]POG70216.1 hypothetical protein GLOIN_2v1479411 [Rhizophagus irregularis DAOM 181602=DAOM 197198]|eukprot:XP_025177082.1 hypothetical protein GLOIN_2v1479411 [Rhizophagus irregularis DAOM 181602=DAOM 197198]
MMHKIFSCSYYGRRNEILDKSMIFWKMRCNKLNEIDKGLGIDKNVKKQHFGKEQFIDKTRISKNKKHFNLQCLQSHIYYGLVVLLVKGVVAGQRLFFKFQNLFLDQVICRSIALPPKIVAGPGRHYLATCHPIT